MQDGEADGGQHCGPRPGLGAPGFGQLGMTDVDIALDRQHQGQPVGPSVENLQKRRFLSFSLKLFQFLGGFHAQTGVIILAIL